MRHRTALLLLPLRATAYLAAETIKVNPNPTVTANAITDTVTGADLTGLIVTATFGEGSGPLIIPMIWAATGPTSGSASGGPTDLPSAVSISVTGDANGSLAWNYTSILLGPLISLEFDGRAAGVYFDRTHSSTGTLGSGPGKDLVFSPLFPAGIESSIVVTYSNAVALAGSPPENDLYARLQIDFPNSVTGPPNFQPQDFAFTQDADKNVVPEVASSRLVAEGFMMLGVLLYLLGHRVRLQRPMRLLE
jgi:hypothetical protein